MSRNWDAAAVRAVVNRNTVKPKHKYGASKVEIDGYKFDSKKEGQRYRELRLLEKAGKVELLAVHEVYPLRVNGTVVAEYELDFRWLDKSTGCEVHEDVKSPATKTSVYRLKAKLMLAIYGIQIRET